jgi:hypothetical protein
VEAKFLVMERQIKQAEAKVEQRLQMAQKEKAKREAILAEVRLNHRVMGIYACGILGFVPGCPQCSSKSLTSEEHGHTMASV